MTYTTSEWNSYAKNTFSYLGNNTLARKKQVFASTTEEYQLSIYPNPSQGVLNINNKNSEITRIQLIAINGQTILDQNTNQAQVQINSNDYPDGIYFLRVFSANNIEIHKVVFE
ncbi:MAG: T9SS type A sorting domain-containing protein [Flavobacteriales bacterium]|nr:T9SS type A sorting domain-containing protein [Flavobacteriales bacterium]